MTTKRDSKVLIEDGSPAGFGARLAIVRHELGKTQIEFAKRLAVSLRTYHHYEKGQRSCTAETLALLSREFGVDLNWLVLGLENVATADDADKIEEFAASLDTYLARQRITLSAIHRRAVIAKWYQGRQHRRAEVQDEVAFWVEMVR